MLEKNNISISHPSDGHASHVERVILSLQRLLYQQIEQAGIKILPDNVSTINNRHHRIIKMSRNEAEKKIMKCKLTN